MVRRKKIAVFGAIVVIVLGAAAGWLSLARSRAPQELAGTVSTVTGDCMPVVDPGGLCVRAVVSRAVYVREPVPWDPVRIEGSYLVDPTPLVASTVSGPDGSYELSLPPGRYSLFVHDEGREYCNWFASDVACLVEIGSTPVHLDLVVDHAIQ